MELNGRGQRAVRELGDAINLAIEESLTVADAIDYLRQMGYEPNLNIKLEIGLQEIISAIDEYPEDVVLELTEDDLRTLRRMKIKVDD